MISARVASVRRCFPCFPFLATSYRLLLTVVCVCAPALAPAQAVSGKVTDAAGRPLVAASVTVEGTQLGGVTREDGTYRIAQVPAGTRTIVARRLGYTQGRRTIPVTSGGATRDFQLAEAAT